MPHPRCLVAASPRKIWHGRCIWYKTVSSYITNHQSKPSTSICFPPFHHQHPQGLIYWKTSYTQQECKKLNCVDHFYWSAWKISRKNMSIKIETIEIQNTLLNKIRFNLCHKLTMGNVWKILMIVSLYSDDWKVISK